MNIQTLIEAGLSPEQAEIYTSLLEHGPQTASSLAKSTSVKRTYVYRICQELAKLNLATTQTKANIAYFAPLSPSILLSHLEAKKATTSAALQALVGTLPQLESMFRLVDTKPIITYYEGVDGVKNVYMDTLTSHTPLLSLVETTKVLPEVYQWLTSSYVKQRVTANIPVLAIVTDTKKQQKYTSLDQKELRQSKVIDSNNYPFQNEIIIYDNKVAIINHNQAGNCLGFIIQNESITQTFRSWFNLTWNLL